MSKTTKQRQIANRIRDLLDNDPAIHYKRQTREGWRISYSIQGLYPELFKQINALVSSVLTDRRPSSDRSMAAAIAYRLVLDLGYKEADAARIVASASDGDYGPDTIRKYYRERYKREADNISGTMNRGPVAAGFPGEPAELARYVLNNFNNGNLPAPK